MADVNGFELSMDLSEVLAQAKTLDKKIVDLVSHSTDLLDTFERINNLPFSMKINTDVFDRIKKQMTEIGDMKVSANFDTDSADKLYRVIDKIVESMMMLSFDDVKLFDTTSLNDATESLFSLENRLAAVNNKIGELRKSYNKPKDEFKADDFVAPINPKTDKPYTKSSEKYKQEKAEHDERMKLKKIEFDIDQELEERKRKQEADSQIQGLLEEKRRIEEELKWAKKSEDERLRLAQNRLDKLSEAERKHINDIRKEYKKITSDELDLMRKSDSLNKANIGAEGDSAKAEYERQMLERDNRRKEIEIEYGDFIVDIAEDAQRRILDIETKRIKDRQKAKAQADEAEWKAYLSTSEGALGFADSAKTISEMKEAQKYLLTARDKTDVSDTATIDALNKKYQELRITIEELSKAEKNENSLQPKVRTEYARLLKELDKIQEARIKLGQSSAFQTNDKEAQAAYGALVTREIDVQRKIKDIRNAAQGQLIEVDRKYAAEKAQIELSEIERVEARRAELARKRFESELAQNSKYGTISSASVDRLVNITDKSSNVAQDELAIKKLSDALKHLDKNSSDYDATVEKLNRRIKEHEHNIKMATDAQYRENDAKKRANEQNITYQGALDYSKRTKTINEQIQAIKYLKEARANLEKQGDKDSTYLENVKTLTDEINRQQSSVDELTGKVKNSTSAFDSMKRAMIAAFSIDAIKNFVNQLVTIRGEFEMQHRSLQILLQDRNEADKLWDKTVQLAVKSPLTTQQLVTYTKQLAAYRIENEKLYETNKMLADVSQGLGVDMDRLILAYGQVKAANFLRGTELRQFSEAGVNLLDELANRFTTLEGRAVSVGDVFERVSKRMVSFKDVAAVFETITSEGGMFYQMQEKQSETLKGQIMNLKDSYQLMLNDIGQSYDSFMKGTVSMMRGIINSWRSWSWVIVGVATAIQAHLVGKGIVKLVAGLKSATIGLKALVVWMTRGTAAMKAFARANKMASLSSPWIAVATAIASLTAIIIYATTQASKLNEELSRIDTDLNRQLQESIDGYLKLATAVTDVTKSVREQNEALVKLQSNYGEILKDKYVDIKYLKETKDGYTEATKAIQLYYEALAIERKKGKVREEYEPKVDTQVSDLTEDLKDAIELGNLSVGTKNILSANISAIVQQTVNDINSGKIGSDSESIFKALFEKMATVSEVDASKLKSAMQDFDAIEWAGVTKNVNELSEAIGTLNEKLNEVEGLNKELIPRSQVAGLEASKKQVEIATSSFNQFKEALTNVANGSSSFKDVMTELSRFNVPKGMEEYKELLIDVRKQMIAAARDGSVAFQKAMPKIEQYFAKGMNRIITTANDGNVAVENFGETIIKQAQNKSHQEWADDVFVAMEKIATAYKSNTNVFKTIIPDAEQSLGDYQKVVKGKLEEYEGLLKQYSASTSTLLGKIFGSYILSQYGFGSKEELETAIKMLEKLNSYVGNYDKRSSSKKTDDTYSRRIKLVEDMRKAYDDLNKTWGKNIALEKIQESFGDEAKELKVPISDMDVSTIEGYIEALMAIESLVKKDAKAYKEWKKALREANLELEKTAKIEGFEETKRELDKLFDKYELSVEIDKLNMPKDIAEGLFGAESIDLSELRTKMNKETDNLLDDLAELRKMESKSDAESLKNNKEYQKLKAKINEKWSQEEIKLADETNKKLDELETKSIEDRLKKYTKYLNQSFSELGKIYVNGADQILEIEKTYTDALAKLDREGGTEADKKALKEWSEKAIQGVQKETQESVDKQAWDAFKSSAMYEQLFSDIEHLGTVATDMLIDRLNGLKEELKNLPPEVYKSIQQSIDKLEAHQIALNPFEVFKDSLKEVRKLEKTTYKDKETGKTYKGEEAISLELSDTEKEIEELDRQIALLETYQKHQRDIIAMKKAGIDLTKDETDWLEEASKEEGKLGKLQQKRTDAEYKASNLKIGLEDYKKLKASVEETSKSVRGIGDAIGSVLQSTDKLLDAFGVAEDDSSRIWLNFTMGAVQSITQMVLLGLQAKIMGVQMNSALGIIGWIATALQVVVELLVAVFQAHDKSLQRQIDDLKANVDELQKSWENLKDTIDTVFSSTQLRDDMEELRRYNAKMIEDYTKMIALEEQKKGTDDEKIKDYKDEIEDLRKAQKELEEETMESFGATYNVREATREFVDAWYDAFKETGKGLDGLKEHFRETFTNILAEQAVMTGAGAIMQPLFDEINKSLAEDYTITDQEYANIDEKQREQLKKLDEFLTGYYERYGDIVENQDSLSGLQKGIQGITEEQADIIAAFLSSIRFYIAQDNQNLTRLTEFLVGNDTQNPMLSQLKIIAAQTSAINSLLEGVTKGGHSQGGRGIKVFIN